MAPDFQPADICSFNGRKYNQILILLDAVDGEEKLSPQLGRNVLKEFEGTATA